MSQSSSIERRLKEELEGVREEMIDWRRDFHRHPEIGLNVERTAGIVRERLLEWGLEVEERDVGVVGLLRGGAGGSRTIAIRADMDALPLGEETGLEYSSAVTGRMHACGHDAHTAIALGAARVLSALKDNLVGNVKFIFQPGEEGPGGARPMIEAGALENPAVDAVLALHVWSTIESGQIGLKSGVAMAAPDVFRIVVRGKGCHGAHPDLGVDPVVIGSHLILALQELVSRETDPLEPVVLSCGSFHSGSAANIIPETAEITGTVRTLTVKQREKMKRRIKELTAGLTRAMGADYELEYELGYPPTINNPETVELLRRVISGSFGEEAVQEVENPSMGGEDFAYFLERVPGAMFFLGNYNGEKGTTYPAHSPHFMIDEEILPTGVEVFCRAVFELLAG